LTFLAASLLSACAIGPDHVRPAMDIPAAYKETRDWKIAEPKDELIRGKWWQVFADNSLNALAGEINVSNQSLKAAEARYLQATALAQSTRAGLFPTVSANAGASRSRSAARTGASVTSTAHTIGANAAWEVDLWGRVRRQVESGDASAEASAADLEAVRLSLQSELAVSYFQLRVSDEQKKLFDDAITEYEKSLQLTRNRYNVGVAAKSDVIQAEAQLKSTQAQAIDLGVQRAQLEHSIAVLIGKAPAAFTLPPEKFTLTMPKMPAGMPSSLLERRPDIAAAERRVMAANAQIGVAKSAWFPTLSLSASTSYASPVFAELLNASNRAWSLGPQMALTLLDFGKRAAATDQAIASWDQTVANYRQTVLEGFQEVEDNLAALRILEQESKVQEDAVRAARESVALTINQYKAGTVSYLSVVTVQASLLSNERTAASLLGRRLTAAVGLIRALGGGWSAGELGVASPQK
jgi:NodT family efflux transporter outer membrane factor (OMF) lipoprotein